MVGLSRPYSSTSGAMDYGNALMNTIGQAGLLVYFAGFFVYIVLIAGLW